MTSINVWGPATWNLFHTISIKIKDEHFINKRPLIIKIIKNIVFNLPCPDCKEHGIKIFRNITYDNFKTKNDLINFLFNFHNLVNYNTRKNKSEFNILQKYKAMHLINVINNFYIIFNKHHYNSNLLLMQFNKNNMMKEFKTDIAELIKYCDV